MRSTANIEPRIAVRAYYRWLNVADGSAIDHWLQAEIVEQSAAEQRAATARKAAAARWSKTGTHSD